MILLLISSLGAWRLTAREVCGKSSVNLFIHGTIPQVETVTLRFAKSNFF
jgi:hypothetical protein